MTDEAVTMDTSVIEDEEESLLVRAIARAARDRKTRWASYDLAPVTPLESFADYAAASAKRREIALARSSCSRDLTRTVTEITRGFALRRNEETERQARDILAGRVEEAFEGFEELNSKVERLSQRLKAYGEAVRIQDEEVAAIRSERSIDAALAMAPTHRKIAGNIAELIAQLRTAFDMEEASRAAVTQAGYDARLPSFATSGLFGNNSLQLDELERRARDYARNHQG